jgi:hypothetical protein
MLIRLAFSIARDALYWAQSTSLLAIRNISQWWWDFLVVVAVFVFYEFRIVMIILIVLVFVMMVHCC